MNSDFDEVDAVILCGGKGTRLSPLMSDRPKALAPFGNTTFLDILIDNLCIHGFKRFILCIGYMKDQIKKHYIGKNDFTIIFSEEGEPLGTGGALKKAGHLIQSETFVVMNGDSFCNINFQDFLKFHNDTKTYSHNIPPMR